MMNTDERLDNLERELTRLSAALSAVRASTDSHKTLRARNWLPAVLLLAAVAWFCVGAIDKKTPPVQALAPADTRKVVRANEFVLEDENGKMRASLSVVKEATTLVLLDHNGRVRVSLGVDKDGPGVFLSDEDGKLRVVLSVDKDGAKLHLYDEKERLIWRAPR